MRRIALLAPFLLLTGCGFNTWWNPPFSNGTNPNMPPANSENMRRVMGQSPSLPAMTPEPGNVWPGPTPPAPTLGDIEKMSGSAALGQPEQPVPGSPLQMGTQPGSVMTPQPPPRMGSSSPSPNPNPAGMPPLPSQLPNMGPVPSGSSLAGPAPPVAGQVLPTQQGPAVTTGGTNAYQTITTPGGGNAIVVPNGNGTSTVIYPNGKVETVPTPK